MRITSFFLRQRRATPLVGALLAALLAAGCSDSDDNNAPAARPPGPGPSPLAPELIMDETTPAPGIPMSFPDGVAVFQEDDGEWVHTGCAEEEGYEVSSDAS